MGFIALVVLMLQADIATAKSSHKCDLSKFGLPVSVEGSQLQYDESILKITVDRTKSYNKGDMDFYDREAGESLRFINLEGKNKNGEKLTYTIEIWLKDGNTTGIDWRIHVKESPPLLVRKIKVSNEGGRCLVENYSDPRIGHTLYNRTACSELTNLAIEKKNIFEQCKSLAGEINAIIRKANNSNKGLAPLHTSRSSLVHSSNLGSVFQYIESCGQYSEHPPVDVNEVVVPTPAAKKEKTTR